MELTLVPWEQIHSEATERFIASTIPHLEAVSKFCNVKKSYYCMVLGNVTHCHIICAYIYMACIYTWKGLEITNLTREDVNNPSCRNNSIDCCQSLLIRFFSARLMKQGVKFIHSVSYRILNLCIVI